MSEETPPSDSDEAKVPEDTTEYKVKVIYDGSDHDHAYSERGLNHEGFMNVWCTACWHGSAYNPKTQALVDSRIVDRP